jgi:hypothetical protein
MKLHIGGGDFLRDRAGRNVQHTRGRPEPCLIPQVSLASGDPAVEILPACEALRPVCLVMGTHGKGAVGARG